MLLRGVRPLGPVAGVLAVLLALLATRAPDAIARDIDRYQNPVHAEDFADPFVLRSGGLWFAYSTHRGLANIQILSSTDLLNWQSVGTALPFLPDWARGPSVWAPTVLARPDHHVLYYAVRERSSGRFCVAAAKSTVGPQGPFFDTSAGPLVCQRERGGTIDPSVFVQPDGRAFLLFKSEGIAGREPTRLWSAPLYASGLRLAGSPVELLRTEQRWEGPIIENPAMAYGDGRYFLFYAANRWETASYATGYAVCDSPLGPCHRPSQAPVLASGNGATGPGGADFFTDANGGTWIAYHAWTGSKVGYQEGGSRSLRIDRVTFAGGRPWIDGPSTKVRPFAHRPGPPRPTPAKPAATPPAARPPAANPPRRSPAPAAPQPSAPLKVAPSSPTAAVVTPLGPPVTAVPSAPVVRPLDLSDRAGGFVVAAPESPTSPAVGRPAALAALLALSVGVAGGRQLIRGRRAPSPSDRGR